VSYSPTYDGPIAGYVVNHLHKNYWKVARTMPREDVLQEAYVVFLRCKRAYPDMDTPQHFMALFKTAYGRHFIDLARADTAERVVFELPSYDNEDGHHELEMAGDLNNDGELALLLEQAPSEVVSVLNLFLNAPQELLELALGSWQSTDKRCKTGGSRKLCALLGLPADKDIIKIVTDYFRTT
jgi:DNA-directed RNA polymerase specialized sigma24 family protein